MRNYKEHIISAGFPLRSALIQLQKLAADAILFVVDHNEKLVGSLTDGDVRRGIIKGLTAEDKVDGFINTNPKFIRKCNYRIEEVIELRRQKIKVVPVIDEDRRIMNIINFRFHISYLPIDALLMAGGKGSRLKPLTDNCPKPLLKVGDKPILEHNIDRLAKFGIDDFWISIRYLGNQIERFFGTGDSKNISIQYVKEEKPLGTLGAISQIEAFQHDYVLICNSDILTTLDFEDFFMHFLSKDADMSVATIPYNVSIPYAVMETQDDEHVISFKEKPTYTYYSNAGIYLLKRDIIERVPKNSFFDTTDLMQDIIESEHKLTAYPVRQYWLDIGKPEDYQKAQEDIKHINL